MRVFRKLLGRAKRIDNPPPENIAPVLSFSDSLLNFKVSEHTPVSFSTSARLLDEVQAASSSSTATTVLSEDDTELIGIVKTASPLLDRQLSILGNYTCVGHIKHFPHVVVARHTDTGAYVIIKSQEAKSPRREEVSYKSIHEAAITKLLSDCRLEGLAGQRHIVAFVDHLACFRTNVHLSVLEYCNGGSLFDFVKNYGKWPSFEVKVGLIRDFTCGLCYMHSLNVAHRDFKLDNMFLTFDESQNRYIVKIGDFGFSTIALEDSSYVRKTGSAHYAAPELLGRNFYNPMPADVWAYGVAMFTMFECEYPFEIGDDAGNVVYGAIEIIINGLGERSFKNPDINRHFGPLLNTILQYNPDLRPTMDMVMISRAFRHEIVPLTREVFRVFKNHHESRLDNKKHASVGRSH